MGRKLGKNEIVGIILLLLVVVGVTSVGVIMHKCSFSQREEGATPGIKMEVVDSLRKEETTEKNIKKKKTRSGRKKSGKSKSASSSKSKNASAEWKDPFSDTIPVDD